MKRPALFMVLFLALGIVVRFLGYGQPALILCAALMVIFLTGLYVLYKKVLIFGLGLFFAVGYILMGQSLGIKSQKAEAFVMQTVEIYAKVQRVYSENRFDIKTDEFDKPINIQIYTPEEVSLERGDYVFVKGRLEALERPRNPGGFDEFLYLRARKVEYTLSALSVENHGATFNFMKYFDRLRTYLTMRIDKSLPNVESGMLKAMLLGDKSELDTYVKDLFKVSGVYHVLVVSGMHIGIVFLACIKLLSMIGKRFALYASVPLILFYILLTGASLPAVRAGIVCVLFAISQVAGRDSDGLTAAAIAAIALLVYEPLYLFDVGFQYSFSSVFGILLLSKPIYQLLSYIRTPEIFYKKNGENIIYAYLSPICAASISITVVSGYYFYVFTPYSILVNAAILLTMSFLVSLGLLALLLGLLSLSVQTFLLATCYYLLRAYNLICETFLKLPFSVIITGRWTVLSIVLYIILLCSLYYTFSVGTEQRRTRLLIFASVVFVFVSGNLAQELIEKPLIVTLLDVGQGDGIVVSKGREAICIDGGGLMNVAYGQNTGRKVILPYLEYLGVSKLSGVFITHADSDHATGILEILDYIDTENIFTTKAMDTKSNTYQKLQNISNEKNVPLNLLEAGDKLESELGEISILHPNNGDYEDSNDSSLVMLLTYGEIDFLFTGDIADFIEDEILNSTDGMNWAEIEVLKLSHHGSKYANTVRFLETVAPNVCIVSAGRFNTYNHPHPDTAARIEALNIPLLSTKDSGAVILKTYGHDLEAETCLSSSKLSN